MLNRKKTKQRKEKKKIKDRENKIKIMIRGGQSLKVAPETQLQKISHQAPRHNLVRLPIMNSAIPESNPKS